MLLLMLVVGAEVSDSAALLRVVCDDVVYAVL
jgi:hypothetical protein